MKKLEDISKENIFKVPEGYFEKLSGVIQSRVAKPESRVWFTNSLKFALPMVALLIAASVWLTLREGVSLEDQLGEIQTEQLLAYLEESETSVDLYDDVNLNEDDLISLEEEVYLSIDPLEISNEELSVEPDNY
jgi:hypothetical protein